MFVCCGLMSHSVMFHLYSDGTVVQFRNLDLLPGTQCHGQLGVFSVQSLPDTSTGTPEDVFNLLAIRLPTRGEGMAGIEPGSPYPQSSPLPLCRNSRRKQSMIHPEMIYISNIISEITIAKVYHNCVPVTEFF